MKQDSKNSMEMTIGMTIGVDLGDRYSHLCCLDASGKVVAEERIPTKSKAFEAWFGTQPKALVVFEAGTHAPWVGRVLSALGHETLMANPRMVRLIYANRRKNDRLDAAALAKLGRLDPELLYPIQPRSEQTQADRAVLRSREVLVNARTSLINSARGQVKAMGGRLSSCSSESFPDKVWIEVPTDLKPAIRPLLDSIEALNAQIDLLDARMTQLEKHYPATQRLQQIPGVGPVTALAFVLTIEDPARFRKSRDVGPYLGLTPRQSQSGDSSPQLGITKAGDSYLRKLLVQCAHTILGPFGPDSALRRKGLELAQRGGVNAKKRAVTAVARKLAVVLHSLWVSGADYRPEGRNVLA